MPVFDLVTQRMVETAAERIYFDAIRFRPRRKAVQMKLFEEKAA